MPVNTSYQPTQAYTDLGNRLSDRALDTGESVYVPNQTATGVASVTQQLTLAGFRAVKTETITRLQFFTAGTAAGATPTLVRAGVYVRQAVTNIWSLVASFATDTTLFAAANTTYTKTLTTPFTKVAGQDYAVGLLIVSAAAFPTMVAPNNNASAGFSTDAMLAQPISFAKVVTQADLPTSIPAASVVASVTGHFHAFLLN